MPTPQVRADLLIRHLRAAEADLLLFFTGSPPRSAKAHGPLPAVSAEGRVRALALSRALRALHVPDTASAHRRRMREVLDEAGVEIAYAEVVDPITLGASRDDECGERRALIAGLVEGVRLIDNAPVTILSKESHAVGN